MQSYSNRFQYLKKEISDNSQQTQQSGCNQGVPTIADVAISKRPLLFNVWAQLRLRNHQNFYEIFTRKQFLPTSAGNAQAQLHFCG